MRAEFAEFRNELEAHIDERVEKKIGQDEHLTLVSRVAVNENRIDTLRAWQAKIVGALALAIFLSAAALEVAIRKFF